VRDVEQSVNQVMLRGTLCLYVLEFIYEFKYAQQYVFYVMLEMYV